MFASSDTRRSPLPGRMGPRRPPPPRAGGVPGRLPRFSRARRRRRDVPTGGRRGRGDRRCGRRRGDQGSVRASDIGAGGVVLRCAEGTRGEGGVAHRGARRSGRDRQATARAANSSRSEGRGGQAGAGAASGGERRVSDPTLADYVASPWTPSAAWRRAAGVTDARDAAARAVWSRTRSAPREPARRAVIPARPPRRAGLPRRHPTTTLTRGRRGRPSTSSVRRHRRHRRGIAARSSSSRQVEGRPTARTR